MRDQSGMKRQLSTLQQLIGVMDPELYSHLGELQMMMSHGSELTCRTYRLPQSVLLLPMDSDFVQAGIQV